MIPVPDLADVDVHAPSPLRACLDTYRRWLHLPGGDQVIAALGAVAANVLAGDPLWMLFVGAPSTGKTETIEPLAGLDFVHPASTLTEAALLSGTPKKERVDSAKGGLLREVGDFGVVLAKDFSGVLSMNRDARAQVLAALRECYDGSWTRHAGVNGGLRLSWTGKLGLLGAVTPSIDRHHAVMGALGERFVLYRLHVEDRRLQARRRLANRGQERQMREELAAAAADVLGSVERGSLPHALDDVATDRLIGLADFVTTARTAVERDGYDREVVVMPSAEAPTRLVVALGQLLAGCEAVGADPATSWRIVEHAAWSCVPEIRRRLLERLNEQDTARTADLSTHTTIPRTTTERALEDLALLGVVDRTKSGSHDTAAWTWALTAETRLTWPNASPEMYAPLSIDTQPNVYDDFSGKAQREGSVLP